VYRFDTERQASNFMLSVRAYQHGLYAVDKQDKQLVFAFSAVLQAVLKLAFSYFAFVGVVNFRYVGRKDFFCGLQLHLKLLPSFFRRLSTFIARGIFLLMQLGLFRVCSCSDYRTSECATSWRSRARVHLTVFLRGKTCPFTR